MREQIQRNLTEVIKQKKDTLLYVSIRLGKTKVALDVIEPEETTLWIYPRNSMLIGYQEDLIKFPPKSDNIVFTNISSIKKYAGKYFDNVVIDEPQLCDSAAQLKHLKTIRFKRRMGLSGTMNKKTLDRLQKELGMTVGATYSLEDGIRDGIVKDYKVFIHFTELDNTIRNIQYKRFGKIVYGTEAQAYEQYSSTMSYFDEQKVVELLNIPVDRRKILQLDLGFKKYMSLRTNLLYNSTALMHFTADLIRKFRDKKAIIYTLRTDIADRLADKSYHTKNKDDETLEWFRTSTEGHLGVVDCVTTGITIQNLNTVIFHSYDSNTENLHQKLGRSLLHEYAGEYSNVHICALKDTQNEKWIEEACSSLDIDKIFYVIDGVTDSKINWLVKLHPDKQLFLVKETNKVIYYVDEKDKKSTYSYLTSSNNKTYSFNINNLIKIS